MNDVILGVGILVAVVSVFSLWVIGENKARRNFARKRFQESFGSIMQKEYTYEELDHISQFFYQREKEGFYIDDITWNDLEMERIFVQMNQSASAVGSEVLYDLLRKPVFEKQELENRQSLMEFFTSHEKERVNLQMLLSGIKKPGNVSVFEAIHVATEVKIQSSFVQTLQFLAFFLSLLCFMISPNPGIYVFLGVCVFNIATYMGMKQEIESYLTCFRCVMQLLQAQKNLKKLNIPELSFYVEQGEVYAKKLAGFQRGSNLVIDRSSTGGGIEGMAMDYIRMLTHVDLIKFRDMMKAMKEHQKEIQGLLYLFGYLDSMISIASVRKALPYYCIPKFEERACAYMEVKICIIPLYAIQWQTAYRHRAESL